MPNYNFRDNDTGEEYTIFLSLSERDEYVNENNVTQIPTATVTNWRQKVKVDHAFNDILKKIKKDYPRSNVNTFY